MAWSATVTEENCRMSVKVSVDTVEDGLEFAKRRYPIIVRPAFTLGGAGHGTAESKAELATLLARALELSPIGEVQLEGHTYRD